MKENFYGVPVRVIENTIVVKLDDIPQKYKEQVFAVSFLNEGKLYVPYNVFYSVFIKNAA